MNLLKKLFLDPSKSQAYSQQETLPSFEIVGTLYEDITSSKYFREEILSLISLNDKEIVAGFFNKIVLFEKKTLRQIKTLTNNYGVLNCGVVDGDACFMGFQFTLAKFSCKENKIIANNDMLDKI